MRAHYFMVLNKKLKLTQKGRKKKLGQHPAIDTLPFYQSNLSQLLLSEDKVAALFLSRARVTWISNVGPSVSLDTASHVVNVKPFF